MSQLIFRVTSTAGGGKEAIGTLLWGQDSYGAVSGPYEKGSAPLGDYAVETKKVVSGPTMDKGYCITDSQGKLCFFIPITPKFQTDRNGLGIHPDGNVPGSLGCIVIRSDHARRFWDRWMQTGVAERPDRLTIEKAEPQSRARCPSLAAVARLSPRPPARCS